MFYVEEKGITAESISENLLQTPRSLLKHGKSKVFSPIYKISCGVSSQNFFKHLKFINGKYLISYGVYRVNFDVEKICQPTVD